MKAVALFDPINSGEGLKTAAKKLGFQVVGVFTRPVELFEQQFHLTRKQMFHDCDHVVVAETLTDILSQLKPFPIVAAIAGLDSGVELADETAHALKLFGNTLEHSKARRDKGEMRKLLQAKRLSCPAFATCTTEKTVTEFAKTHPWPLVIKTPRGAATSQVFVCEKLPQLLDSFRDITQTNDFFGGKTTVAVVEEYIGGHEYIVDTFSDGKTVHVTDVWLYEKIELGGFQNIYYNVFGLPVNDPECRHVVEHAKQVVQAFGLMRGPAHLEIKDDPKRGPTLVEINARLAGARIPEFTGKYSNFDVVKATVEVFVHGTAKVPKEITYTKHFAMACCPLLEGGKVKSISGIDKIEKLPSYEMHQLNIKPGDVLETTKTSTTIALFVYLAHEDRAKLLEDLAEAHRLFQVSF